MAQPQSDKNIRPDPDALLVEIIDYVYGASDHSDEARRTAQLCLMDSIGCAVLALGYGQCRRHLGPWFGGATVANGARVIGTDFQLDPIKAAFDNGALIRWLDFNDTWLAAEWGHPSDNLGAILAVADYRARQSRLANEAPLTVADVHDAMIRAHEIQGVLALENSFNRVGLDHVVLVKVASTAVVCKLLELPRDAAIAALSHAWVDGQSLRTYRHAPNTGSRKSWAAGDATSRAVRLAAMAQAGEVSIPSAITASTWGFNAVSLKGGALRLARPFGCYVMENVLFKVSYPAEFHAQTAVEAALQLHPEVTERIDEIEKIIIHSQESAVRIISKTGPLHNPADRDHCLQYMVAVALLYGELTAAHYNDDVAADPRIDRLREKMEVFEEPQYSADYLDPEKRAIANAVQCVFTDTTATERVEVHYPLGHRRRREESIAPLEAKFSDALGQHFSSKQRAQIEAVFAEGDPTLPVDTLMDLLVANTPGDD